MYLLPPSCHVSSLMAIFGVFQEALCQTNLVIVTFHLQIQAIVAVSNNQHGMGPAHSAQLCSKQKVKYNISHSSWSFSSSLSSLPSSPAASPSSASSAFCPAAAPPFFPCLLLWRLLLFFFSLASAEAFSSPAFFFSSSAPATARPSLYLPRLSLLGTPFLVRRGRR